MTHISTPERSLLFCSARTYFALHERLGSAAKANASKEDTMTISTFTNWFGAWKRYRVAVRELEQLSDRELADLGIIRSEIETVARQSAGL